jgi:hypothetical protein
MIVRIFKSGVSNGEAPVKYLLGDRDHTGELRSVKPEVLEGDPQTTIDVINTIQRKHKYISGCMAFRDTEKPSKTQMYNLIDDFKQTFCPGLSSDNFNSLFVLHQEKGNVEIHFVIPGQELSSGRRMNIHPPGKRNIAFFESFTKITNQKMGYAQVVADPLKLVFTDFERKTAEGKRDKSNKGWVQQHIVKAIQLGKIGNRSELCQFLDDELGIVITRQGKDYLSVKFPGAMKAKRLKGALYAEDANYQSLLTQSITSKSQKFLSPVEFETEQTKLDGFIHEREQFNIKAYLTPKPIRRLARQRSTFSPKTTMRRPPMSNEYLPIIKKIIQEALIVAREKTIPAYIPKALLSKSQSMSGISSLRKKAESNTAISSTVGSDHHELNMTIAEVQQSMDAAIGEMNHAKNPTEAAKLHQRVIQLRLQLDKLKTALQMAKIRELNAVRSTSKLKLN